MIKCLSKKRTYQTLLARWNETKVDTKAAEKEYSILEECVKIRKGALERLTQEYEKAKSELGDIIVEEMLAEKDGKELGEDFEVRYDNVKGFLLHNFRWYQKGKEETEEAENVLKRYNEEKEKADIAEEKARRELGLYLAQYTCELFAEREKTKEELKLFIEECEEKFGHWYDINDAKDYSDTRFCKCVFCGESKHDIPWYNKNYICKTYLSKGLTNEHQDALNKINAMKESLIEIQELLEIICFAKEKHEYGEREYSLMGCDYYVCEICGHREYLQGDDEIW